MGYLGRISVKAWISAIFIMSVLSAHACAELPDDIVSVRPNKDGPPTEITVDVIIINLLNIDEVDESFRIDFLVSTYWSDPRLADPSLGSDIRRVKLEDIWHPDIDIINKRSLEIRRAVVRVDSKGSVEHHTRYFGNISTPLDLKEFPFDTQQLIIELYSTRQVGAVTLKGDPKRTSIVEGNTPEGWNISEIEIDTHPYSVRLKGEEDALEVIDFTIDAKRLPGYYLWKLYLPLGLIVMMAWLVFWINPVHFGPQMGLTTASVFTLIAFLIGMGDDLPQINYLTKADTFVMGCMLLVFGAVAEAVIASRLSNLGKNQLAVKIDKWVRWLYPSFFILLIIITATRYF